MSHAPGLKAALKRGALLAAANWPLVAVQFIAESTLKLLLAVPVVGGIFLVVLLLDADVEELLRGDLREIVTGGVRRDARQPGGARVVRHRLSDCAGRRLAPDLRRQGRHGRGAREADGHAGAIERPPLRLQMLRRANRTGIEPFLDGCQRLGGATSGSGSVCSCSTRSRRPPIWRCSSAATRSPTTSASCSGGR